MQGHIRSLVLLAVLWPTASMAQSDGPSPASVEALVPGLVSVADSACASVTRRTGTTAHRLDRSAVQALSDIDQMGEGADPAAVRSRLDKLADEVGSLDAFPMLRLHFLLGYLAGREGKVQQQAYHRAYALALTQVIEKNGRGESEEHALHPCLIANEYDWLRFRAGIDNPGEQALVNSGQHHYDVYHANPGDAEATILFDVTDMIEETEHALSSGPPLR
jgi:hypothetical protein